MTDRVAELELELTRRAMAQAEERERYQKDRQVWADKKKAWVAHEERLKQRMFALRDVLLVLVEYPSHVDGCSCGICAAQTKARTLLAELQRPSTSPAAPKEHAHEADENPRH